MLALLPPANLRPDPAPRLPAAPAFLLSPLEQEILSICLNAPEDPRDVGMLPAMLSAERRRQAPADASAP